MPYVELLDNNLRIRLSKYLRAAGAFVSRVDMNTARASLLEKDFRTQPRSEQRAKVAAEVQEAEECNAHQKRLLEEAWRRKAFEYRRSQLRALKGYDSSELMEGRRRQIDEVVNAELATEYPDVVEEERLAKFEREREKVRSTLLGPGEDYETLPDERRAEVDAAVAEWVADSEALATSVK